MFQNVVTARLAWAVPLQFPAPRFRSPWGIEGASFAWGSDLLRVWSFAYLAAMAVERARASKRLGPLATRFLILSSLIASGWSCGGTSAPSRATGGSGGVVPACVPGMQVGCACTNGVDGAQVCNKDGTGFGACVCAVPAGVGMSGDGGASPMVTGGAAGAAEVVGAAGDAGAGEGGTPGDAGRTGTGNDFPQLPILEPGVPANAAELFEAAADTLASSLCVLEPQLSAGRVPGAMFPSNWLRPRFRVSALDVDLFEIRLHSDAESNDLVVYTTEKTWYLPKEIWQGRGSNAGLGAAAAGEAVSVTIRALDSSAPAAAVRVSGSFNIAPVGASGSILFPTVKSWSLAPNESTVFGFSVGDEGVAAALTLPQVSWSGQLGEDGAELRGYYDRTPVAGMADGSVRRVTRPQLTPDGQGLAFLDDSPYAIALSQLTGGVTGAVPSYLGRGASALLKMPWLGSPTLSLGHWAKNDRVLVTSYGRTFKSGALRTKPWQALPAYGVDPSENDWVKWHRLAWFDLEATFNIDVAVSDVPDYGAALTARNAAAAAAQGSSWGFIETGDASVSNVSPSFNPAGDTLAYVATDYSPSGYPDALATAADVRVVAYNDRAGGVSLPLRGASAPGYLEYEPAFSSDGKLIAFTRAPSSSPDGPYRNRLGEVTVVAAAGGEPQPLLANDPNACAGDLLPLELLNGSPAWAPKAVQVGHETYYFLIFTSARAYGDEFATPFQIAGSDGSDTLQDSTQLYLTTLVVDDATGSISSFPAIYVWNQNRISGPSSAGVGQQFANMTPVWGTTTLSPLDIAAAE